MQVKGRMPNDFRSDGKLPGRYRWFRIEVTEANEVEIIGVVEDSDAKLRRVVAQDGARI